MNNYEHINIKLETGPDKDQGKGLASHPYRVLELVRRKRTQSRDRNGVPNRTIENLVSAMRRRVKLKRRQGTHSGRKEVVARFLKQISLDTYFKCERRQCTLTGIQQGVTARNGKVIFHSPGSMSMARRERDDRNLGNTRGLPGEFVGVGGSTNRSEPIRSRVTDRLVVDRASRLQPAGRPELIKRRGRQNNVARKGNIDL